MPTILTNMNLEVASQQSLSLSRNQIATALECADNCDLTFNQFLNLLPQVAIEALPDNQGIYRAACRIFGNFSENVTKVGDSDQHVETWACDCCEKITIDSEGVVTDNGAFCSQECAERYESEIKAQREHEADLMHYSRYI